MFYFDNFFGKKILKSSLTGDTDCFFTTREFVLTAKDRTDLEKEAEDNRIFLTEKLNCEKIYTAEQTHSDNIQIISKDKTLYKNTDSLISNIENTILLLNYADCVPVILYSKKDNTGAVIHAGWRGTAKEISKKTAEKLYENFNILPENITAIIGPSICKCCFETSEEVFDQLIKDKTKKELYQKVNDKYFTDLKLLNKYQLTEVGIKNIDSCEYCTCCMSDIFFSYRKENGKTARHSAILKIKGDS